MDELLYGIREKPVVHLRTGRSIDYRFIYGTGRRQKSSAGVLPGCFAQNCQPNKCILDVCNYFHVDVLVDRLYPWQEKDLHQGIAGSTPTPFDALKFRTDFIWVLIVDILPARRGVSRRREYWMFWRRFSSVLGTLSSENNTQQSISNTQGVITSVEPWSTLDLQRCP